MDQPQAIKAVGKRRLPVTPREALRRAEILQNQLELVHPYPKPRGFVFKAKTREEYEQWRRQQTNLRLW